MSLTIAGAVSALQTKAGALSGIAIAPTNAPDGVVQLPFAVSYVETMEFVGLAAGIGKWLVTIATEIHCANQQLSLGIAQATPYGDSFPTAVANDPTLAGAVTAVVFPQTAEFGTLTWGTDQHIGWKFHTTVKLEYAV